jgi:hypothetical protein
VTRTPADAAIGLNADQQADFAGIAIRRDGFQHHRVGNAFLART